MQALWLEKFRDSTLDAPYNVRPRTVCNLVTIASGAEGQSNCIESALQCI